MVLKVSEYIHQGEITSALEIIHGYFGTLRRSFRRVIIQDYPRLSKIIPKWSGRVPERCLWCPDNLAPDYCVIIGRLSGVWTIIVGDTLTPLHDY